MTESTSTSALSPPSPEFPVQRRIEFTFELPGTPQQVWHAIATEEGMNGWFLPTDMDEREGGAVEFHMGPDQSSKGKVTGWEPPRRLEYVEPDWPELAGREPFTAGPMVTEMLIEAQSGGTSVLRVVSSAFCAGADWEAEFFEEMGRMWKPAFENLRLYLASFPGQRFTAVQAAAETPDDITTAWPRLIEAAGAERIGAEVRVRGIPAVVERLQGDAQPRELQLRLVGTDPGYVGVLAWDDSEGHTQVVLTAYVPTDGGPSAEREQSVWRAWLDGLVEPVE